MKSSFFSFAFAALLATICPQTRAADMADLSLTPFEKCKKPHRTPPAALLHKTYRSSTYTNFPFDGTVDINGDGWCDWVSTAARPPHRGDVDEPPLTDFIFLGTQNGWRRFGSAQTPPTDRQAVSPTGKVPVFGFIYPTFVYLRGEKRPFIAVLESFEDIAPSTLKDVFVLRWNSKFDMPDSVSGGDRQVVLKFLRIELCRQEKKSEVEDSLAPIICDE